MRLYLGVNSLIGEFSISPFPPRTANQKQRFHSWEGLNADFIRCRKGGHPQKWGGGVLGARLVDQHPFGDVPPEKNADSNVLLPTYHWSIVILMKSEFTAIIEIAPEGGYWAVCPEIPGANGQGETLQEAKQSLIDSIELLLEDRREDYLRGLPTETICDKILVG